MECINKILSRWVSNKQISNPLPRMRGTTITGTSSSSSRIIRRSAEYLLSSRPISIKVKPPRSSNSRPRCKASFRVTLVEVPSPTNPKMCIMPPHCTLEASPKNPSTTWTWCSSLLVPDTRLSPPLWLVIPSLLIGSPCNMVSLASLMRLKWIAVSRRWTIKNFRARPSLFLCRLKALKISIHKQTFLSAIYQKNSHKFNSTSCLNNMDTSSQLSYRHTQTVPARDSVLSSFKQRQKLKQLFRNSMGPTSVASRLNLLYIKRSKTAIRSKTAQNTSPIFLLSTWTKAPQTHSWNLCFNHLARSTQSKFRLAVMVRLLTRAMSTSRGVKTLRTQSSRWTRRLPQMGPYLWSPSTSANNKTCKAKTSRTRWSPLAFKWKRLTTQTFSWTTSLVQSMKMSSTKFSASSAP